MKMRKTIISKVIAAALIIFGFVFMYNLMTFTYTYADNSIIVNVTFKVKNGSWNDGTKADKTKTLSRGDGEDLLLTLSAGDIPGVGNMPDEGYWVGSWDVEPPTGTSLGNESRNLTYTYTYAGTGPEPRPEPGKDDDYNDDNSWRARKIKEENKEEEHDSKPAVVNPDTVEGYFAVNGQLLPGVAMGKMKQGPAAQAVFNANRPVGWLEAFTFNIAINGKVDYTLKNGKLTISIPMECQKAGRTFALMALDKNGKAWTFPDTDTNPATLTANINVEGYAFALIYKD